MQTDQPSRVREIEVPHIVVARLSAGRLFVYKSVVVDDNDEVMNPVWEMAGNLTLEYSQLYCDDSMMFGEAIGRVFKIG